MDAVQKKQLGEAIREVIIGLAKIATELDPPPKPKDGVWVACKECGAEYAWSDGYRPGQRCESCDEADQTGYLGRKGERTAPKPVVCTCDGCGWHIHGEKWVGTRHTGGLACDGTWRLDPAESERRWIVRTAVQCTCEEEGAELCQACDGKPLDDRTIGLTRAEMDQASQAAHDAAAEWLMAQDLDELSDRTDDRLDIAATFTGRRG